MGMIRRILLGMPLLRRWNKYYATYTEVGGSFAYSTGAWGSESNQSNAGKSGYNDYNYPASTTTGRFTLAGSVISAGLVLEEPYPGDYQYVWHDGTIYILTNDGRTVQKWRFIDDGTLRRAYLSERSSYQVGTPGVWTYAVGDYIRQFKEANSFAQPYVDIAANGLTYSGEATFNGIVYYFYRDESWAYRAYSKP